jgi:phenylacetyl-CoA:acceptor oxidoreductase
VDPVNDTMDMTDITSRLAQEAGIYEEYIEAVNKGAAGTRFWGENYDFSLDPKKDHSAEEIWDNFAKAASAETTGGKEIHDLAWFRENGFILKDYNQIDWYIYPAVKQQGLRFELPYQERLTRHGRQLAHRFKEMGFDWWDKQLEEYEFMPTYEPFWKIWDDYVTDAGADLQDYPFWALTARSFQYAWGANVGLPLINEVANNIAGHKGVIVNRRKAREMGIEDGDEVVIESVSGRTEGKAVLREGIRPDVVLMIGQFDHWKTPYAKDLKLPSLNSVTDISLKLTDSTGSGADLMRVKLFKAADAHLHQRAAAAE